MMSVTVTVSAAWECLQYGFDGWVGNSLRTV